MKKHGKHVQLNEETVKLGQDQYSDNQSQSSHGAEPDIDLNEVSTRINSLSLSID